VNPAAPSQKWFGGTIEEVRDNLESNMEVIQRKYLIGYCYIVVIFGLSCWKVPGYKIMS
jgi:hypothetical protein